MSDRIVDLYAELRERIIAHPPPPNIRPWAWAPPHPDDVAFRTAPFDGSILGHATSDPPTITIAVGHDDPMSPTDVMVHEMAHITRMAADMTGDHDAGWRRLHDAYRRAVSPHAAIVDTNPRRATMDESRRPHDLAGVPS